MATGPIVGQSDPFLATHTLHKDRLSRLGASNSLAYITNPDQPPTSAVPRDLFRPGQQPNGRHELLRISAIQMVIVHHHGAVAVPQPLLQRHDRRIGIGHL